MHKSDVFLIFCLFYLGGIFFASFFISSDYFNWALVLTILSIIIVGVFWKYKQIVIYGVALIFFSLAINLYGYNLSDVYNNSILGVDGKQVEIIGTVDRDFDAFNKKKVIINVNKVYSDDKEYLVSSKVLIFFEKYQEVNVGDKVLIEGLIKRPENFSNFDYVGYLAKDKISMVLNNAKIKESEKGELDPLSQLILNLKDKVSSSMSSDFTPDQSPVMQAMVLGESEKMSPEYKDKLSKTGLSHAIAISGSHFVLIASFLFALFLLLGFWKNQALSLVLVFLSFYIILISFPSSAVRAGIMIGLVYLAKIFSRQAQEWRLLIFAAFFMAIQNPLVIKHDLGFQLSFLAVLGLIYLSPIIDIALRKYFKEKFSWLKDVLSATMGAQLAVIPFLSSTMGGLSLSGFFANIIVVPLMPFCLGLGFIYSSTFFIPYFSKIVSLLCFPFIHILNTIIDIFYLLPFSFLSIKIPDFIIMILYAVLGLLIYKNKKNDSSNFYSNDI